MFSNIMRERNREKNLSSNFIQCLLISADSSNKTSDTEVEKESYGNRDQNLEILSRSEDQSKSFLYPENRTGFNT